MKKKTIVIHGATNTSNFGDVLFAELFFKRIKSNGDQAAFLKWPKYGVCKYVADYVGSTDNAGLFSLPDVDAVVMMSSGYFGDSPNKNKFIEGIRRIARYFFPIILFVLAGKHLLILGVGGGPLYSKLSRSFACFLMNRAKVVTVRDIETKNFFVSYGVKRHIDVTSDTALVLVNDVKNNTDKTHKEKENIIFVHLVPGLFYTEEMKMKIIPAINKFITDVENSAIVLGFDCIVNNDSYDLVNKELLPLIATNNKTVVKYSDPQQLCKILCKSKLIITMKLHVGIVGAAYGNSVLSFPLHDEKTPRFYRQIGEENRCVPLALLNDNIVYDLMKTFYDKPIHIPNTLVEAAERNLQLLDCRSFEIKKSD